MPADIQLEGPLPSTDPEVQYRVGTDMNRKLRVCLLAFEVWPYSAEGELAEIVAGLSSALAQQDVDVRVFSPCHSSVAESTPLKKLANVGPLAVGNQEYEGSIWVDPTSPGHYFVDQNELYSRRGIYLRAHDSEAYPDEFERLIFFVQAALAGLKSLDWQPDIVHCQDWPTALAPAFLKLRLMGDPFYSRMATVLTVHNVYYQGRFGPEKFPLTGLPPELLAPMSPFEYFGDLNLLKAGICYADAVTTVSPQYAREIQTEEFGGGLHEVFRMREADLVGILNGIDYETWDPRKDRLLVAPFGEEEALDNEVNKRALQVMAGLPESRLPLVGLVMDEPEIQGFDLFLKAWPELKERAQWLILGKRGPQTPDPQVLAREDGPQVSFRAWSSAPQLHRFHAGCDILLMPSRVQPCGLHQFYGMRYGCVPLVRYCGGLRDSVAPFGESENPTGFRFFAYEPHDLVRTFIQALQVREQQPHCWRELVHNGMAANFSWSESAAAYVELYRRLIHD